MLVQGQRYRTDHLTEPLPEPETIDYMASTDKNIILKNVRGAIGKQIVVKQYGNKTVITVYPDMSRVKRSTLQKENNKRFREAVRYARKISGDEAKAKAYRKQKKLKSGKSVYHAALSEFMKKKR